MDNSVLFVLSDNPDLFHGSPVGVQVICRRLEEEKVLAIAEEVQATLG
jgi:amidase